MRLLGAGTGRLAGWVAAWLPDLVAGPASATGSAWLASYVLMSGSLVAALAVSMHANGLVSATGLFLLVAGGRLGASGVIILMGGMTSLRHDRAPLRQSTRLGMLASIVSLSVYGPIVAGGAAWSAWKGEPLAIPGPATTPPPELLGLGMMVASLALLWLSLWMLDKAVARMDRHWFRSRWGRRLVRPEIGFLVGMIATAASASITVSVGALVPLYNQGLLTRREVVPYILGASVGTLSDTLLIAAALGSWDSFVTLVILGACAALVSLSIMAGLPLFTRAIEWLMERITHSTAAFWLAASALLAVPLAMLLW